MGTVHQIKKFRILEGYGDYSEPQNCWGVGFVTDDNDNELRFATHNEAVEFSVTHYEGDLFARDSWQSFWCYVTDADTIAEAFNEWDMRA
jgi:hypothetical protein